MTVVSTRTEHRVWFLLDISIEFTGKKFELDVLACTPQPRPTDRRHGSTQIRNGNVTYSTTMLYWFIAVAERFS